MRPAYPAAPRSLLPRTARSGQARDSSCSGKLADGDSSACDASAQSRQQERTSCYRTRTAAERAAVAHFAARVACDCAAEARVALRAAPDDDGAVGIPRAGIRRDVVTSTHLNLVPVVAVDAVRWASKAACLTRQRLGGGGGARTARLVVFEGALDCRLPLARKASAAISIGLCLLGPRWTGSRLPRRWRRGWR